MTSTFFVSDLESPPWQNPQFMLSVMSSLALLARFFHATPPPPFADFFFYSGCKIPFHLRVFPFSFLGVQGGDGWLFYLTLSHFLRIPSHRSQQSPRSVLLCGLALIHAPRSLLVSRQGSSGSSTCVPQSPFSISFPTRPEESMPSISPP